MGLHPGSRRLVGFSQPLVPQMQLLVNIYQTRTINDELNLNAVMASITHARPSRGIAAEHLSKVWQIDMETAKCTLEVMSQNNTRTDHPTLSRNY
eukprot:3516457-Ditylum_brightwellii.AAC.1